MRFAEVVEPAAALLNDSGACGQATAAGAGKATTCVKPGASASDHDVTAALPIMAIEVHLPTPVHLAHAIVAITPEMRRADDALSIDWSDAGAGGEAPAKAVAMAVQEPELDVETLTAALMVAPRPAAERDLVAESDATHAYASYVDASSAISIEHAASIDVEFERECAELEHTMAMRMRSLTARLEHVQQMAAAECEAV